MITAVFTDNSDYARATGLWQWDYGQRLRIEGLHLPTAVEIHFALTEFAGDAIPRVGTTKDGVTEVVIPDSLLENLAAGATYEIYAWIYLADKTTGETIKRISMQVKCRPKPEAFDAPGDAEIFRDAIAQVNASADRAETAREGAEAAKKAAEEAAGKIEGEITGAGQIAEQVRQDAEAVAKDKQAVSQMVTETTQNAQKAASSAQAAERSGTAAESAKAGAESAMKEVERDRTEVSETHRAVEQLRGAVDMDRQAVAADRRAVENTALQFGQFAQSAINAVGQAQEAAVGAVSAEGQRQTTAVQNAGTQAVSEVGTAKAEAVQAVTTEGDTQTKRVQDAAAGIVADREQIAANKAGVESLQQNKADAIVETVQGETMTLTDSSDKLFEGLRVFGKSTQDGTPSVENPVPIVNAGESGSITVEVTGRNLFKNSQHSAGFYTGDVGNTINSVMNAGYSWEADLSVLPGTELTLSVISPILSKFRFFVIDNNRTILLKHEDYSANSMDYTNTFTMPENGSRLCVSVIEVSAPEGVTIMLNIGNVAFSYEPCIEPQTLILATPNGLPGVPVSKDGNYTDQNGQQWVCDEIDLTKKKYVQRVKDFIITQDTQISTSMGTYGAPEKDTILARYLDRTIKKNGAILCRELIRIPNWNVDSESVHTTETSIDFRVSRKRLGLGTETTADENKTAVLKFLETTPLHCLVELATPIERDLTPEELAAYKALHTNYPTTVIANDEGAHMEVSYVADTGTYIRNMEERLNAKLVNIQSALISQKNSGGGIKVTDSSRVPVVRFAMWGKTEQVRTSGKNLIDIKGEITFSKGTFDIKDNLIDCTLADTWGGSYIMFSKEYPAGEYTFSADKMKNDTVQKIAILLTVEPLSNSADACVFNDYYKKYLIKNGKTLSRDITFKVDSPFEIGIPLSGDNDVVGETLSVKNIQLERGASVTAYEPYSGGFPSPSPDWEQPIEITDQPVTVTIKGGTEQQSITLIPPKPMTKWDKLEKVDGVWYWVYQSKHILSYSAESITGEYFSTTGELSAGAEVYYKADVPENIPLPQSEQDKLNALTMYAGTTEVTNTGGCNMELTYTVDTKSYVDSKIAAISAAVLEV